MHSTVKQILVTGSHRSGTTWVGRTISQHPRIKYVNEPFNVDNPNREIGLKLNTAFTYYPSSNQKDAIRNAFDNLLNSSPLKRTVWMCRNVGLDIKTPLRFCKHLLLNSIYQPRILIKDPLALLSAGWLHERYDLKVICMIRNPLAFVGSLKKAAWDFYFEHLKQQKELMQTCLSPFMDEVNMLCGHSGDFIDRACLLWNILHFTISNYRKQYPYWFFLKHEDIAMNPIAEFQRLFIYLGLNLDSSIRQYIEEFTSTRNPKEVASTAYQPRNAKKSLDNWKERLLPHEIDRVRIATRNIAAEFYRDFV